MHSTASQCAYVEFETCCIPTPNAVLGEMVSAFRSCVSWVTAGGLRAGDGEQEALPPAGHSPNRHGDPVGKGCFEYHVAHRRKMAQRRNLLKSLSS